MYGAYEDLQETDACKKEDEGQQQVAVFSREQAVHEKPAEGGIDDAEDIADDRGQDDKDDRGPRAF